MTILIKPVARMAGRGLPRRKSMAATHPNAVKCKLSKGGFSDEIVFEVELAEGGEYAGGCSRFYCYNGSGNQIGDAVLSEKPINGRVQVALVKDEGSGKFKVQVPDGEVLVVKEDQLTTVKEASPHVPVRP